MSLRSAGAFLFLLADQVDGISRDRIIRGDLLPTPHGELDDGGDPWPIFPALALAPGEPPGPPQRSESFVPADPNDPVGQRCCPGDVWGSWYYNVTTPTLVPFIVPKDAKDRVDAGVVVVPGGGHRFLAWHKEGTRIAKWLNSVGISAFVLKYRIPSDTEATRHKYLIDSQRAVSFLRQKSVELGLNLPHIGMIGFSAGAIAAAEASCATRRQYKQVDKADRLSHVPDFVLNIYGTGPEDCSNPDMPPTFVALAINDQCIPHESAMGFFGRIDGMKNPTTKHHELHVFGEGRHGYGDCSAYVEGGRFKDVCAWTINAEFFIKSVVLGRSSDLDGNVVTYSHH